MKSRFKSRINLKSKMIILGIDPGTTRVGYGVIRKKDNNLSYQNCGCLFFEDVESEKQLLYIFNKVSKLLKKERPNLVALEKIFFAKNKKTAMTVSEARGVIILAVLKAGLSLKHYTPNEVKQAVSTYGRASKKEVQKMTRLLLGLKKDPQPDDAADALALAICAAGGVGFNKNVHKRG